MPAKSKKMLIIQAAGLGYDALCRHGGPDWGGLRFYAMQPVFPALTCVAQASFRTASLPEKHGVLANGYYQRELARPLFWEQSAALVSGRRIWDAWRRKGRRVGLFFWQQSLGEPLDCVISPAPIHKHHGGMIQDCYAQPPECYARMCGAVGRAFNLADYWGPRASARASEWIATAMACLFQDALAAPDLCLTYLPALDYDLQRWGPDLLRTRRAWDALRDEVSMLTRVAREREFEVVVFGDYAVGRADGGIIMPNQALLQAGLFRCRRICGMLYPDFYASRAWALADNEIAQVYVADSSDIPKVKDIVASLPGVECVWDRAAQHQAHMAHARGGELLLVAKPGWWFHYPWWRYAPEAPDYARHVDIHNKPGFDPCELFWGWPPGTVSRDPRRIGGTHGRAGPGRCVAWASTCDFGASPTSLVELAQCVGHWLDN